MRDCENCKHKIDGYCESWDCHFEPKVEYRIVPGVQRYIRVEDIKKVCDPCKDHGVRQYTAREIAEEYARSVRVTKL